MEALWILLLSILNLAKFFLLTLLVTPVHLIRLALYYFPCRPKRLGRMLSRMSTLMCSMNIVISTRYKIRGECEIEFLRDYVQKRLILATDNETRELLYPEYQQHPTTWCGFSFWEWDQNFSITRHVKQFERKISENESIDEIEQTFMESQFGGDESPWQLLLLQSDDSFTLLFKFQHVLSGGSSIFKSLVHLASDQPGNIKLYVPPRTRTSFHRKVLNVLSFPFLAPWQFVNEQKERKKCSNLIPPEHLERSNPIYFNRLLDLIPLPQIKVAATAYRVSTTSVLLAGITGGLQAFLLQKNYKLPEYASANIPIPVPTQSDRLENLL